MMRCKAFSLTFSFFILTVFPLSGMHYVAALKQTFCERFYKKPEYAIHLMWINKELKPEQPYIHPAHEHEKFKENILGWAEGHPKSQVCYLYDSKTTSPEAVKRTQDEIVAQRKKKGSAPIVFKDMWSSPKIVKYADVFAPRVPVYPRADLARVITSIETVEATQKPVVYADMDVTPVKEDELFDEQTKKYVEKYGIVMDHNVHGGFENSFHILAPKPELLTIMKKTIVKPSVSYIRTHLNASSGYCKDRINPEFIFHMHNIMFFTYYHMRSWGSLVLRNKPFDERVRGFEKINKWVNRGKDMNVIIGNAYFASNKNNPDLVGNVIWAPTKKMQSPPRKNFYYDKDDK